MIRRYLLMSILLSLGAIQMYSQILPNSDKARLIGAWHLVNITGPDGKPVTGELPKGMLIYTSDGHVSVQLMYDSSAISNEYVEKGYEASFGSYDLNETTHTVTHHIIGANTRDRLLGKNLPRVYQLTPDGHLIIRSADARERWSVVWERY